MIFMVDYFKDLHPRNIYVCDNHNSTYEFYVFDNFSTIEFLLYILVLFGGVFFFLVCWSLILINSRLVFFG